MVSPLYHKPLKSCMLLAICCCKYRKLLITAKFLYWNIKFTVYDGALVLVNKAFNLERGIDPNLNQISDDNDYNQRSQKTSIFQPVSKAKFSLFHQTIIINACGTNWCKNNLRKKNKLQIIDKVGKFKGKSFMQYDLDQFAYSKLNTISDRVIIKFFEITTNK